MKGINALGVLILILVLLGLLIFIVNIKGGTTNITNNITNNIFNNTVNNITNNITNNNTIDFSGSIPASNVSQGLFGNLTGFGNYSFPENLNVQENFSTGNITVAGRIALRSQVSNTSVVLYYTGSGLLSLNQSGPGGFIYFMPAALNPQISAGNSTGTGQLFIDMRGHRPICLNCLQTGLIETGGGLVVDNGLNVTNNVNVTGEMEIGGIRNDGSGQVVCIKADKTLGTCSSVVGLTGACTCG